MRWQRFKYLKWVILLGLVVLVLFALFVKGRITSKEYKISERQDSGYSINIIVNKRYLITADGIFSGVRRSYSVDLIGEGKDWSFRNQNGTYYSFEEIKSINKEWDFGYAWITSDNEYLYLNLYVVKEPDSLIAADVNGKYRIAN